MGKYDRIVSEYNTLISKLTNLKSKVDYNTDFRSIIISKELEEEIKQKCSIWKKIFEKKFDEWFIKQANIAVLYRKQEEIKHE